MASKPAVSLREEFSAWSRAELEDLECWREILCPDEIEALVRGVPSAAQPHTGIAPLGHSGTIPARLRSKLSALSDTLHFGRGFALLRRLPLERLTPGEAEGLFRSVAGCFGRVLAGQDIQGRRMGADEAFLTAEGDLLAQLCTSAPAKGGALRLVSAVALHNEMARRYPEYLPSLYARMGQARPLFAIVDERLEAHVDCHLAERLARRALDGLDGAQQKGLTALNSLAEELALDVDLEPGDMLFANCRRVLVAHRPYESYHELGKEYAVMRLWLATAHRSSRPASERRMAPRAQAAA